MMEVKMRVRALALAVALAGSAVFADGTSDDVTLEIKDGRGVGTATFSGMNQETTTYSLTVGTPSSKYHFVTKDGADGQTHSPSGWKVARPLNDHRAAASKTLDEATASPGFFGTPLAGKMYVDGDGPGDLIPWAVNGEAFFIHSTAPEEKFDKVVVPWGGAASFTAFGGKSETAWKLEDTTLEGSGATFSISADDFREGPNGEAPKIKKPGTYTLSAHRDGSGSPSDSMKVVIPKISMTKPVLVDKHGKTLFLAARLDKPWKDIKKNYTQGEIEFSTDPKEINEGELGYAIDVVLDERYKDVGMIDEKSWGDKDHKVTYLTPVEKIADLRPIGGPDFDVAKFKVAAFAEKSQREERNIISKDQTRTVVMVYSTFQYLVKALKKKEKAIDYILWKYKFLDLSPIDGRPHISYKPGGNFRGLTTPGLIPGTWYITLYDGAFSSENVCASTTGHEVEHARKGTWPLGASEGKAYNWEYRNAYRTGLDRYDIDTSWESQEHSTNYPDSGYKPYVDND